MDATVSTPLDIPQQLAVRDKPWEFIHKGTPALVKDCYEGKFAVKGSTPNPDHPERRELSLRERATLHSHINTYCKEMVSDANGSEEQFAYSCLADELITFLASTACARCGKIGRVDGQQEIGGKFYCSQKLQREGGFDLQNNSVYEGWAGGCADIAQLDLSNQAWVTNTESSPCPACKVVGAADRIITEARTAAHGHDPHSRLSPMDIPMGPYTGYSEVKVDIATGLVCGHCYITRNRPNDQVEELRKLVSEMEKH